MDGLALLAAFGLSTSPAPCCAGPGRTGGALPPGALARGSAGLHAVALGAVAGVMGAQRLGGASGVPDIVTGLFAIGLLCALPESYSTWRFTREGEPTVAAAAAMGDGIASLTVAPLPPALAGAEVGDRPVYLLNLGFLAAVLAVHVALDRHGGGGELGPRLVWLCTGGHAAYLAATVFLLTRPGERGGGRSRAVEDPPRPGTRPQADTSVTSRHFRPLGGRAWKRPISLGSGYPGLPGMAVPGSPGRMLGANEANGGRPAPMFVIVVGNSAKSASAIATD